MKPQQSKLFNNFPDAISLLHRGRRGATRDDRGQRLKRSRERGIVFVTAYCYIFSITASPHCYYYYYYSCCNYYYYYHHHDYYYYYYYCYCYCYYYEYYDYHCYYYCYY